MLPAGFGFSPPVFHTPCSMMQILMHHIRDCLPEIKSKLNVMMQSVSQELTELGEPTDCVSAASLGATLVSENRDKCTE